MAGAIAEIARYTLSKDFRHIDPSQARIILIEGAPYILSHLPVDLIQSATRQLEKLGVQVRTSTRVKTIREGEIEPGGELVHGGLAFEERGEDRQPRGVRQRGGHEDGVGRRRHGAQYMRR